VGNRFQLLTDDNLRARLSTLRSALTPILNNNLIPHLTNHDVSHSDEVARIAEQLARQAQLEGTAFQKLDEKELFVLYAACYLHDVGLQIETVGETSTVKQVLGPATWASLSEDERRSVLRMHHHRLSAELISRSINTSHPPIGIQLTDADEPDLVAALCLGHGLSFHDPEYGSLIREEHPRFRLEFLLGLLRLADILEECRRRALRPKANSLLLGQRHPKAEMHWWRNYYTKDVDFKYPHIQIYFEFPPERYQEFAAVIPRLQVPQIRQELDYYGPVLGSNGVSWYLAEKSRKTRYANLDIMPDSVLITMLQELRDRERVQDAESRLISFGQRREAQLAFDRRLAEVDRTKPKRAFAELKKIAEDMYGLDIMPSAWMVLSEAYRLEFECPPAERMAVLVKLAEWMLQDDQPDSAIRDLVRAESLAEDTKVEENLRLRYWEIFAEASGRLGAYPELCQAIERARALGTSMMEDLLALRLEVRFLTGADLDKD